MSKAKFWQKGESIDFKNSTGTIIEANTIIPVNSRVGVTGAQINPGETGSLHIVGIFEMAKNENEEIIMGANVFYNGIAITAIQGDDTPAGYAVKAATAADTTILVKLLG